MPTSSLESCTSLHLVFKVHLWLATTYWSEEKIKRSLTFHCSGFLIIWTPLILASICRAGLCNAATVQEEPGTREMLDLEHPRCAKKAREVQRGQHVWGLTTALPIFWWCLGNQSVWGRFLLVTKMAMQSGQTSWAVNSCTLIFAVTEVAKQKQTDHFRTWPPYLHLPQPIKLQKKTGPNFEMETKRNEADAETLNGKAPLEWDLMVMAK